MNRLSVVVITRNEASNIGDCLASAAFADERIVVDSGSSDGTVDIAQKSGARVIVRADWAGFGLQKNRALDAATGDWVFSIDADERITPELAASIRAVVASAAPPAVAYDVSRRSMFCGQWIEHSGWRPDRVVRLFRRGGGRFSEQQVHERFVPTGKVGRLDGELLHYSMLDFETVIDKVDRYSSAGAQDLLARGVRGSMGRAVGHGIWAFVRTYFLRLGFLDGRLGLALAISNAEGTYYRYLKLWLLQRVSPRSGTTPPG